MLPAPSFIVPYGRRRNVRRYPFHHGYSTPCQWVALPSFQRHEDIDHHREDLMEEDAVFPIENLWKTIADHDPVSLQVERNKISKDEMKSQGRRKRQHSLSREMIDRASKIPKIAATLEPLVQGFFGLPALLSSDFSIDENANPNIWQQKIDCLGFDLSDVKVKMSNGAVLMKALRTKERDGAKEISSMTRRVTLPQNIDMDRITCKVSPQGNMVLEAPYLESKTTDRKQSSHDGSRGAVKKLLAYVLPELKQLSALKSAPEMTDSDIENECSAIPKEDLHKKQIECDKSENDETMSYNVKKSSQETKDNESTKTKTNTDMNDTVTVEPDNPQTQCHVIDFSPTDSFVPLSKLIGKVKDSNENSSDVKNNDEKPSYEDTAENCEKDTDNKNTTEKVSADQGGDGTLDVEKQKSSSHWNGNESDCSKTDTDSTSLSQSLMRESVDESCHLKTRILCCLEMPSYNPESITVNFDENKRHLLISARKEVGSEKDGEKVEAVNKTVHVPEDVDENLLQCQYRDGSLSVIALQKSSSAIRHIPVNI